MARKLRIQYPGAVYHVMNRGDRREAIFCDDADRQRFIETLGEVCGKTGWQVHAFCLMPNQCGGAGVWGDLWGVGGADALGAPRNRKVAF